MANILNENFELLKQLFTECLHAKNNTKDTVCEVFKILLSKTTAHACIFAYSIHIPSYALCINKYIIVNACLVFVYIFLSIL